MPAVRYKNVVDQLAADIRAGRLAAGTQLPTHRELASAHGIAVVTATRVYAELDTMGLVSGEQGRGTFVRDLAVPPGHGIDQHVVAADTIDLNFNYPSLPGQADLLRRALRDLAASGDVESLLRYQPHGGRPRDRAVVARHLERRGLRVDADHLLIVNGAQHGLTVTVMAILQPGDVVAVDALTYPGFKVLAEAFRLELVPIPATDDGPDLDALDRICSRRRVRAVYTMPTLHNPLGWVTDLASRWRLIDIARRRGLLIVEDASYAYLAHRPPPPLATLAPDLTVYVSGLSKNVATGLRIGFVVAPAAIVPAVERAIRATTWNAPAITIAIVSRWLADGTVDRLETDKRRDAAIRQKIALRALAGLNPVGHGRSYFLWLPLPDGSRADRVAATLAGAGISVSTAEPFATSTHVPQAIRLALGSVDLDTLADTVSTVRRTVNLDAHR